MTALQELIEILNESQKFINDNDSKEDKYYRSGLIEAIEVANKLLEKEKEQIKNSYLEGDSNGCGCYDFLTNEDAEQYYNETYKQ